MRFITILISSAIAATTFAQVTSQPQWVQEAEAQYSSQIETLRSIAELVRTDAVAAYDDLLMERGLLAEAIAAQDQNIATAQADFDAKEATFFIDPSNNKGLINSINTAQLNLHKEQYARAIL